MDTGHWGRRGKSFGSEVDAAQYDAVRPRYPAEGVTWMLGPPGRSLRVLDLGAGTGKLTRTIVELSHDVVAVDPSAEMLGALAAACPGVECRVGRGESIPLPDGDVDAVLIGQAWHWMDTSDAGAEILRVLRRGGSVGMAWNVSDTRHDWVAELDRRTSDRDDAARANAVIGPDLPEVPAEFGSAQRRTFDNPHSLSREDLLVLASTWSWVALHPERDAVLGGVGALVDQVHGAVPAFTLPQVCHCYRYELT